MGRKRNWPQKDINQGAAWGQNIPNVAPSYQQEREYYRLGENLGSESRNLEFKSGPGFITHGFRENVSKYVCAFVNSHEKAKLLLGVNDNGEVTGYSCSHYEEDKLRRDTDEAVKDIKPPIFPGHYTVRFVSVNNEHNTPYGDLKVIEIHVFGDRLGEPEVLYSNHKGAYQRRDGGVHELTAYEIQEWTKQKYKGEMEKMKKNLTNSEKDMQNRQSELRQLEERLRQKDAALKLRDMEIQNLNSQLNEQKFVNMGIKAENQTLRADIDKLKSHQGNEASNQQVLERLDRLEDNLSVKTKNRSKVCVIS